MLLIFVIAAIFKYYLFLVILVTVDRLSAVIDITMHSYYLLFLSAFNS